MGTFSYVWLLNQLRSRVLNILHFFTSYVDANIARSNRSKYERKLEIKRKKYIRKLSRRIIKMSKLGYRSVTTIDRWDCLMTNAFSQQLREYFEARGFTVIEMKYSSGTLEISWG